MNKNILFCCVWVLLGITCVYDLKYKKVPLLPIICGGVVGGVAILIGGTGGGEIIYALMPGILLLIVAFLTKEKVGYGDGILLLSLGLLEGAEECFGNLLIGLFLVAVFGIVLFIVGKKEKNQELPFVPFLMAAHVLRFVIAG